MTEATTEMTAPSAPADGKAIPDYLKDLPVQVDVILGSVKLTVRELLSCGPGSVIDIGKKASEPFDLLVNNKLVARGEIVMIHDRLGLKVVQVIDMPVVG
jgi:flagellar motor switch protein FliN/FliY